MIVVTGATGQYGSRVVEGLLGRIPADQLAVSVRDPATASALADRGVRVRRGDFADPATLDGAFEGATQVLVVSPDRLGEEGVAMSTTAVDAAYRAGAERVLYTSHQAAGSDSAFAPGRDHAAVEAHLAGQGRAWTSLRNGYYATSLVYHLGAAAQTGELRVPADGPVAWTDRGDLADAAVAVLAGVATFEGPTPPLVGAESLDLEQVAAILSEVAGSPVRRVVVDDEEWVAQSVAHGAPEHVARLLLGSYQASRRGELDVVDPTLGELIGRPPRTVRDALRSGT